jgi:hypothetical protein
VLDLLLELLVPLWSEDNFLQQTLLKEKRAAHGAVAAANSSDPT